MLGELLAETVTTPNPLRQDHWKRADEYLGIAPKEEIDELAEILREASWAKGEVKALLAKIPNKSGVSEEALFRLYRHTRGGDLEFSHANVVALGISTRAAGRMLSVLEKAGIIVRSMPGAHPRSGGRFASQRYIWAASK